MMEVVTRNVHGYLTEVQLPPALTDQERLEWLHKRWKDKQDAVPDDDETDVWVFRHADGREIKRTLNQLWDNSPPIGFKEVNMVKFTLGEAEKGAK